MHTGWSKNNKSDDGDDWTWEETEFLNKGWIYTPTPCETKQCYVHLAFHGCDQSPTDMVENNELFGLNMIAATNDIIVVYPGSDACFNDGGEYDTKYYLTNEGLYPEAMRSMLCRLTTAEGSDAADECSEAGPF